MEFRTITAGEAFAVGDHLVLFIGPVGMSGDGMFEVGDPRPVRLASGQWRYVRQADGSLRHFKIRRGACRSRMKITILGVDELPSEVTRREREESTEEWQAWKQSRARRLCVELAVA